MTISTLKSLPQVKNKMYSFHALLKEFLTAYSLGAKIARNHFRKYNFNTIHHQLNSQRFPFSLMMLKHCSGKDKKLNDGVDDV